MFTQEEHPALRWDCWSVNVSLTIERPHAEKEDPGQEKSIPLLAADQVQAGRTMRQCTTGCCNLYKEVII